MNPIYSIGHGLTNFNETAKKLVLLKIDALVDVRSRPYSKFNMSANRPSVASFCRYYNIKYLHIPELGGLHEVEPNLRKKKVNEVLKMAKKQGAKKITCIGIHGVLAGNAAKLVTRHAKLITTNTIPSKYAKIDVSPIIIDKLKKLNK